MGLHDLRKWTAMLMGEMLTEPARAVDSVRRSLSLSEYPLLPAIPLAAWCAAAGTTRLPFVPGITTIYGSAAAVVPAAKPLRFLTRGSASELPMVRTDLAGLERLVNAIDRVAAKMGGGRGSTVSPARRY